MKKTIPLILLFMVVGFAAVSTSLFINGNTSVFQSNDFNVYFSDAVANGVRDLSLVESETELVFETTLSKLGEKYTLDYDITNSSKNYDAKIEINCLGENEYLRVENTFDTNTLLKARETRRGSLELSLKKSKLGDELKVNVTCTLNVTAEERTTLGEGDVADPVSKLILKPGDILTIGGEDFYFVKEENKRLTILAVDSLGTNNLQSDSDSIADYGVPFGPQLGWEYTPGPKEIDLTTWAPTIKSRLDNYASFISNELSDETVTADLMTVKELDELGCNVSLDYAYHGGESCKNSENASWLLNDQYWWTKSASTDVKRIWLVAPESVGGYVTDIEYPNPHGIRPKLVISKSAYTFYLATNNN